VKSKRNALVTGASGFVGSHLVRRLVDEGWYVDFVSRDKSDLDAAVELLRGATAHRHDGSTAGLQTILSATKPDVVFHLASLFISEHQPAQIDSLIAANLLFGTQLAEAMTNTGCLHLVNTGTSWQHFENAPYNPVNLYAATKQAFEDVLEYFVQARGMSVVTLKLFDTYGPHDRRKKLFYLLSETARTGSSLAMSPGEQLLDIVHVDDVTAAFVAAANRIETLKAGTHERYGISSGSPQKLRDVVVMFERVSGMKLNIRWGDRAYRAREVMRVCDLPQLPGWHPKIPLETGLRGLFGAK
jgi:nucleoside-diphosphate-sugar epimerase